MAVFQLPFSQSPGTVTYGPFTLADDVTTLKIALANWPEADYTIGFHLEMSFDGGVTWEDSGSMNPTGGARVADPRFPATGTDCSMVITPIAPGTARQLHADVTVAGGTVSTILTVTTS